MTLRFELFLIIVIKYYEKKAHQYDERQLYVNRWANEKKQEIAYRRKCNSNRTVYLKKKDLFTSIYRDQHPLLIDLQVKQMFSDGDIRINGVLFEKDIYIHRIRVLIDIPLLNSYILEERMIQNRFLSYLRKADQIKEILEKRKSNCHRFNYIERCIMSFLYPFTARLM